VTLVDGTPPSDNLFMSSFAIVPAAGRSVRMGRPKLLLPWGETTVIEATLAAWRDGGVSQTIVIVHPADVELAELCRARGASVVVAPTPPVDMKASVLLGLNFVRDTLAPQAGDAWLVAPADMPTLSAEVIRQLLSAHDTDKSAILVPEHQGQRGHPVLFPCSAAADVTKLAGDTGIDQLTHGTGVRMVDCGELPAASDLDTPDDYHRLQNRHNR
jgi:molybdenum cofactor cytidylyltransferase